MAGFFKGKRRRGPTINKNEEKVRRREQAGRTGPLLKERFPLLSQLDLKIVFITPQGQPLEDEQRSFGPDDPLSLNLTCPGRCGGAGRFDLTLLVKTAVDSHRPRSEEKNVCRVPTYHGSPTNCDTRLEVGVALAYVELPATS